MRSVVNQIQKTHQFLSSQLIYPLILSTLLAGFLFVARVLVSRSLAYKNLPWNLFLAWLPYVFSLWAALLNLRNQGRWWLLLIPGGLWLIFFPNAPYIVTDFLHLEHHHAGHLRLDRLFFSHRLFEDHADPGEKLCRLDRELVVCCRCSWPGWLGHLFGEILSLEQLGLAA